MHGRFPHLKFRTWVGDLRLRAWGSYKMLQVDVPEAIIYLGEALQARGCRLSPKSCIVSSVKSVGQSICSTLGSHGWAFKQ
eukprot:7638983-Pyramimonas_sp.AAC.1